MDNLFDIFLFFVLGFLVGEAYTLYKIKSVIRNTAEQFDIDVDELIEQNETRQRLHKLNVVKLQIERVGDSLLLYEMDTDTFVCQANTVEELAKKCKEYNNIINAIVVDTDKVLLFIDGLVSKSI
jgi:hypothetical protein